MFSFNDWWYPALTSGVDTAAYFPQYLSYQREKESVMFVVCNRVQVNPTHAEQFETLFLSRSHMVDKSPGFVSFQLLRPDKAEESYVVMVVWESKD